MKKCAFWALLALCLMGTSVSCTNTSVDEELQESEIYNVGRHEVFRPGSQPGSQGNN